MKKNRIIAILLSAMIIPCNYTTFNHSNNDIMITADAVDIVASGSENMDKITWDLDSEGTLTINGTGGLLDYNYKGHKNDVKKVIIESGITELYSKAFKDFPNLCSVELSDTVIKIGVSSFANCSQLSSIKLPNSLETLDVWTFSGCTSLESIKIPNSVTRINEGVFEKCSNLSSVEIPDSVTYMDYHVFSSCTSLTSIRIPNSLTSIGYYTFENCTNLKSVEIPDSITLIGGHAFYNCKSLEAVTVPASVTTIQRDAFNKCPQITLTILNPKCKIYYEDNFVTDEYDDFPSVIKGYKGSTAESYATKFNRTFIPLDGEPTVSTTTTESSNIETTTTTVASSDEPVSTTTSQNKNDNSNTIGDANGDGRIDAKDASAILAYYSYLSTATDDVMTLAEFLNSNNA